MKSKSTYIFHYPTNSVGGAQLLFARIATKMALSGLSVKIVERNSSFISNYLKDQGVKFDSYDINNQGIYMANSEDIVVLSASYISLVENFIVSKPETKFFFWELHPFALVESLGFSGFFKKQDLNKTAESFLLFLESSTRQTVGNFIDSATEYNGLAFMCGKNELFNRRFFDFSSHVNYLPIPINVSRNIVERRLKSEGDKIRVSWLGRLDHDKIGLLQRLIGDLENESVLLNVIGDGNGQQTLKDSVKDKNVEITWQGALRGKDLDDVIINHTDIGVAIGTSSLEFANRGVPCVLMPGVNEIDQFSSKKYVWLFESSKGNLCSLLASEDQCKHIRDILNEYRSEGEKFGALAFQYVTDHHSFEQVYQKLIRILNTNQLTYSRATQLGLFEVKRSLANRMKSFAKKII